MKMPMTVLLCALSLGAYAAIDGFNADGLPYAGDGFGVRRNFYQSGRISAKVADIAGIFELNYVGKQPFRNQRFYSSNEQCTFCRCLVPQVLIDDNPYRLTFENTTHYPFGYSSECTIGGVKIRHELVLDRNVAFRRVTVMENPQGKRVCCRIVQMNAGMGQGAKWKIWGTGNGERGTGCLVAEATFEGGAKVTMEIGAANPVAFPLNRDVNPRAFPKSADGTQNFRFDVEELESGDNHLFWWVFDKADGEELDNARVERVYANFKTCHSVDTRFETGDAFVDGWLGYVAPMSAAFEVDGKGAFRASPTYWVWGWDAMVHAGTLAICGRAAEVRRMLAFFRDTADRKAGILHQFATDFAYRGDGAASPGDSLVMPPSVQLFWVILLNDYVNATGDEAFKADCMDFARRLVESAKASCDPLDRLPHGIGWYPDNPYAVGQTKNDIALINCAVYWQGLCAWRELSGEGDEDCAVVRKAILGKLWDEREGYWCDSYDAANGEGRGHYTLYGFYHVSAFARDMLSRPLADYMKREFFMGDRLSMFGRRTKSWCADGNQLGAYYPVTDRTYWNQQNAAGRIGAVADFRRIVASHARVLTYPEGQAADVLNGNPADYSDELGNKQFFAAKGWLSDALDLWLGLRVSKDGVHFHPINDGKPFAVRGLAFRGKALDIEMSGMGTNARFSLNGEPLDGGFIAWEKLREGRNLLGIKLTGETK